MNEEQRYLFDLFGFLHLKAVLTPEQLSAAAAAAAAANDRIEIAHIPGAGHNIRRDHFATYLRQVRSLLAH